MNLNITIKKVRYSGAYITILLISLFATMANRASAQTVGFVQQDVIKKAGVYTDLDLDGLGIGDRQTTRIYYNGMGQTLQTVAVKASPSAMDIIQPYAYDNLGRQTKSYLPYVGTDGSGSYRTNALVSEQAAFYSNGLSDKMADDSVPYTSVQVELSPLQRLLNSGTVGNGFQPGQHAATLNYRSNNAGDGNIIIWGPDGSNLGNYAVATLAAVEGTDADNVKTVVFTDIAGHTVLKRQYTATAGVYLDTYYIYNNAGMTHYVIPPKALDLMVANSNYSLTQAGVNKLIFQYEYDYRGRLTQKIVPGKGAVNMIYDPMNRPVLVQDANMVGSFKWYYIKYDAKGHPISQGIYVDVNHLSANAMQNALNAATIFYESRNTSSATGYYTNTAFPTSGITPLAYSYFDDYDMDMNSAPDYSYIPQTGFTAIQGTQTQDKIKGMPTMVRKTTMTNNTAGSTWLVNYTFYDRYGRAIQTQSNNLITTTVSDVKTNALDFTGAPLQTKVIKVTGSTTTTVLTTIGYDPSHRVNTIDQSYNGATAIRVAAYVYNELGQLIDKKLHSTNGGGTYIQSVDYRYNIRGQLLSINNSKLTSDTGTGSGYTNDDSNDLFGMQFLYDQVDANVGNRAYYNGKLSAVKWMSKDATGASSYERSYKYAYDAVDRYTTATYAERTTAGTGLFNNNIGGFNETVKYDFGGNITTLGRNSSMQGTNTHIQIDTLTYSCDPANPYQLLNVTDGTDANHTGAGFRNFANPNNTNNYSHDVNGNLKTDPNKGLSLTYNDLNRTDKITVTTATFRYITYTYDAGGTLIRKQAYDNNTIQTTTDYIDGFVYTTQGAGPISLSYFGTPEGRVRNTGSTLKPEYIITDQQGNARISFEESATPGVPVVRQENSYYPSGQIMPNSPVGFPPGNTDNKQLYNGGSEWQNDFSNLPDYYQTFYRNYDAALMQFIAVDPEPESAESMTTYNYAGNNPVMFNDPMGNYMLNWQYTGMNTNFGSNESLHNQVDREINSLLSGNGVYDSYYSLMTTFGAGAGSGSDNPLDDGRKDATSLSGNKMMRYLNFENTVRAQYGGDGTLTEKNGSYYYSYDKVDKVGIGVTNVTVKVNANQGGPGGENAPNSAWTMRGNDVDWNKLFREFRTGTGPTYSGFGPNSPMTKDLKNSFIVQQAIARFLLNGGKEPLINFQARFYGPIGPLMSETMTEQFLGSARVSIYPSQLGYIFVVTNTTDMNSFGYHSADSFPRDPNAITPYGTIYQKFMWISK